MSPPITASGANDEDTRTILRDAKVRGVQNATLNPKVQRLKTPDQLVEEFGMSPGYHSRDVLHDEVLRLQLVHETREMEDQRVARIFEDAMADKRKTLAGRTTYHGFNRKAADARRAANEIPRYLADVAANDLRVGEVKLMRRSVNGVDLDPCGYVVARLLEPERQSSSASEQIDADRSIGLDFSRRSTHRTASLRKRRTGGRWADTRRGRAPRRQREMRTGAVAAQWLRVLRGTDQPVSGSSSLAGR